MSCIYLDTTGVCRGDTIQRNIAIGFSLIIKRDYIWACRQAGGIKVVSHNTGSTPIVSTHATIS